MVEYIEPFNFKKIFMEYFIGDTNLFYYFLLITISYASAKFGLSNRNFMIVLILSSLMFAVYTERVIQAVILFMIGFMSYRIFSR